MSAVAARADVGAKGFDCITEITAPRAVGLVAAGMRFGVRYLGSISATELAAMLDAGLAAMPVTYADVFDGATAAARAHATGFAPGTTVWLDVESYTGDSETLKAKIAAWANSVRAGGFDPGLYVGASQPLSGAELYALPVDRYWHSMSMVPEPACGWCMHQLYPTITIAGVPVDVDFIGEDWMGRLPTWTVRGG